jgi:hypothetical protein
MHKMPYSLFTISRIDSLEGRMNFGRENGLSYKFVTAVIHRLETSLASVFRF